MVANGVGHRDAGSRPHPQTTYDQTTVDSASFYGQLRSLYGSKVLKTQLEQLKKQGSYDAFDMKWHLAYDVRPLKGGERTTDANPPSLFWESDIGKWIEAVSYFLSSEHSVDAALRQEFEHAVDDLIDKIERAQSDDGYLNIYFTVVDPKGRFKNLRDMHEMYNCGHLLEGALAHYHWTGSRRFLDCMIRYVDLMMETFGPAKSQLHGYPGHPELELAMARLYEVTRDSRHLDFARYLLEARGTTSADMDGLSYFIWEGRKRRGGRPGDKEEDMWYHQAHEPIHEQQTLLGHSVRAFYLLTAAADVGGDFLEDAKRLLQDATTRKMYVTGGFGSEPGWEGFSTIPYRLPQSTNEGGCYQETCASIACMMTCERILSHALDGHVRDVMELCLLNAVLGGASLDGRRFSYANKLATFGNENAFRNEWFETCCCPPNLSRTIGILGGYTWAARVDQASHTIHLNVYLYVSSIRNIKLPDGEAVVEMETGMPWKGESRLRFEAPKGWTWEVALPAPGYASGIITSPSPSRTLDGFQQFELSASSVLTQSFDMPVRMLSSHPRTGQNTLTVTRGPIVYTAEGIDNGELDDKNPHFAGIGLSERETFSETKEMIQGIGVVMLTANGPAYAQKDIDRPALYQPVGAEHMWQPLDRPLKFVPWFARGNRGGSGRVRTSFPRCD